MEASHWLSRITVVVGSMVVPVWAGRWADQRWGTRFWQGAGLVVGITAFVYQLVAISRELNNKQAKRPRDDATHPPDAPEPPSAASGNSRDEPS